MKCSLIICWNRFIWNKNSFFVMRYIKERFWFCTEFTSFPPFCWRGGFQKFFKRGDSLADFTKGPIIFSRGSLKFLGGTDQGGNYESLKYHENLSKKSRTQGCKVKKMRRYKFSMWYRGVSVLSAKIEVKIRILFEFFLLQSNLMRIFHAKKISSKE